MECIACNRRFKSEKALEKHIKYSPAHAPKDYYCSTCNRSFKSEDALEQHLQNSLAHTHTPKGNSKSFKNKAAQKQHAPAHAHSSSKRWSIYPTHHEHVSRLLEEECLHYNFHNVDTAKGCISEYDTNIMGRFTCHNDSCGATGWSSRQIAITIREYNGGKYNARVYHQRCGGCDSLSRPVLDDSYAERVAYRIKKWNGIFMGAPPPYSSKSKGPHHNDLCEGCKDGHCSALSSWNS
ncbi:hypothetical protein EMPG_15721, partial [Blastomyces silverae]